jgi:hypothetical protein
LLRACERCLLFGGLAGGDQLICGVDGYATGRVGEGRGGESGWRRSRAM